MSDEHHDNQIEAPVDNVRGGDPPDKEASHKEWLKEMRGWLIVLATLAASVTYQAGLNPPGGFWQDDKDDKGQEQKAGNLVLYNKEGHQPGNPVLHDRMMMRYQTFDYLNATAFAMSLVIIILLLNEQFYRSEAKVAALTLTTMIELMSLAGAYIAGSTRDMHNSIYIIVLTCFVFVCVIYMSRILPNIWYIVLFTMPCLYKLAEKGYLPVTEHMKNRVETAKKKEAEENRAATRRTTSGKIRGLCCVCCRAFKYDADEAGRARAVP